MRTPAQLLLPVETDFGLTTPCLALILEGRRFGRHTRFAADNAIVNAKTAASAAGAPLSLPMTSCGSCGRKQLLGAYYHFTLKMDSLTSCSFTQLQQEVCDSAPIELLVTACLYSK